MNPNSYANACIRNIYRSSNTIRIGAEYRVIPSFSIRAGYSFTSSPVKTEVKDGKIEVPGTGVLSSYTLDNATNYITCGVGYKHKGFYVDFAYVYKTWSSEYYPFSVDVLNPEYNVKSKINFNNSSLALSVGYKF